MKTRLTTILCLLLVFATLFAFAGCGQKGDGKETEAAGTTDGAVDATDPWANYPSTLAKPEYEEGRQFTIATVNLEDTNFFTSWCPEDSTGDGVRGEIFKRDNLMYEKYGIDVKYLPYVCKDGDKLRDAVRNSVSGNSYICDMMTSCISSSLEQLFNNSNLYNINALSYINMDTPWWASYFADGVSYNNRLFYAAGMASGGAYFSTVFVMICNTVLQENIVFEDGSNMDIFKIIEDGEWTLEKLDEITETAFGVGYADSSNTKGVFEDKMVYAHIKGGVTNRCHFVAAGGKFNTIDSDNNIKVDLGSENVVNLVGKLATYFDKIKHNYDEESFFADTVSGSEQIKSFINDRALFFGNSMTYVEELTKMESTYAIIPCPKRDTAQTEYYSGINPYTPGFTAFAANITDAAFVGYAAELLGYHSYYTVKPEVYDSTLSLRLAKDPKQIAIMDTIFANLYVDLNYLADFGTMGILHLPYMDDFGIDPYWHPGHPVRAMDPFDYVYRSTKNLLGETEKAGKSSHLWIQGYDIPAGYEDEIIVATDAAYEAGARTILAWSYRGGESNTYKAEHCDVVWQRICEGMRRIRDRHFDAILAENKKRYQ